MKRINNLYEQIYSIENLELADKYARRGKHNYGIKKHDLHRGEDLIKLSNDLKNHTYKTSEYSTFTIYEPKERLIFRLPYYPDRITHWAIMNIMERIWIKIFIKNTYACIKKRGIHKLVKDLGQDLRNNKEETKYCLKLDIRKFYPSINHDILKSIIRKKIKDKDLLITLDEIIDSTSGVPIGNYLSQFFANLYLAYFDHWIKEELGVKYYYRYADDIVLLSNSKDKLRQYLYKIIEYLDTNLKLKIKQNYQIFPVDSRGIDFVGYKFFHDHVLLRKSIKLKVLRLVNNLTINKVSLDDFKRRFTSYCGWLKFCNSKKLLYWIEQHTELKYSNWAGIKSNISLFYDKLIHIIEIYNYSKYYSIHFIYRYKSFAVDSMSKSLINYLNKQEFPTNLKLNKYGNY